VFHFQGKREKEKKKGQMIVLVMLSHPKSRYIMTFTIYMPVKPEHLRISKNMFDASS